MNGKYCNLIVVLVLASGSWGADHQKRRGHSLVDSTKQFEDSQSGKMFKSVSEDELSKLGIGDPKAFGEAWEDSRGLIWGDVIRKKDGSILFMTQPAAQAFCKEIGAELPTGGPGGIKAGCTFCVGPVCKVDKKHRDSDFENLRNDLMTTLTPLRGRASLIYIPQFLPHLKTQVSSHPINPKNYFAALPPPVRYFYWSSTTPGCGGRTQDKFVFDGQSGVHYMKPIDRENIATRCVLRRTK